MTKDEIIEMARQAGFIDADWNIRIVLPHLEAFAKLVAQHEREACAEVCECSEDFAKGDFNYHATLIRARGQA
jgi:hypothetical protein